MKGNEEFLRWSEEWYEKENSSKFSELLPLEKAHYREDLKDRILLRVNALFMVATVWTKNSFFLKYDRKTEGADVDYNSKLDDAENTMYKELWQYQKKKWKEKELWKPNEEFDYIWNIINKRNWKVQKILEKQEEHPKGTESRFDNLTKEEEELYELLLEIKRAKVPIRGKMVSVLGQIETGNWSSVEQEKREKIIKKVGQVCKLSRWQVDERQMNEIIFKLREPYFYCFFKGVINMYMAYKSLKENQKYEDIVEKFDWDKIIKSINSIGKQMDKENPIPSIEEQLEEALKEKSKYQN